VEGRLYQAEEVTKDQLNRSACALILTGHSAFDYELIVSQSKLVFDTRNATRNVKADKRHVFVL
jgi:UDP-N-acetyl-D-glucosamine dehydrogenase